MDVIITGFCTLLALYGLGQWTAVFPTGTAFRIMGTFDNPAGFAACLAAGFPFCLSLLDKSKLLK